jgi:hypothetical protein
MDGDSEDWERGDSRSRNEQLTNDKCLYVTHALTKEALRLPGPCDPRANSGQIARRPLDLVVKLRPQPSHCREDPVVL